MEHSYPLIALTFLIAALVIVPISKRLGLGAVLGYLVAGVLIGPFGLHLIVDDGTILHFSEFGVVLLLFLIGLELHPSHLWQMRRAIVGSGGLQLILSAAAITGIAMQWMNWQAALVVGMGIGLSSTAIALQTLQEKNLLKTDAGQRGFAILLLQDIAVVPMIAILPVLSLLPDAGANGSTGYVKMFTAFGAIGGIVLAGHYMLKPVLRYIASTGMRELFTILSLALVLGISELMAAVGLSMALGTFLAGMLLADSEYRTQLEIDIEPFKGLLMGLFFMAIGLSMNFALLFEYWSVILGAVALLVLVKGLVLFVVAKIAKLKSVDGLMLAILLSQGGEFAFVLFSMASQQQIFTPEIEGTLVLIVALSMLTTPLLMLLYESVIIPRFLAAPALESDVIEDTRPCAIICGFGRMGQIVGRVLVASRYQITVLEHDPNQIDLLRRFGFKAYFGDASRLNSLEAAGAANVKAIVLAMDNVDAVTQTAELILQHFPNARVIARARNRPHEVALRRIGVHEVIRETFLSSVEMAEQTLRQMGMSSRKAHRATQLFAEHDQEMLLETLAVDSEEQLLTQNQEGRESLLHILEAELNALEQAELEEKNQEVDKINRI
jgi:monovalent cation:proton antiporter-2 (CPA2) family protein